MGRGHAIILFYLTFGIPLASCNNEIQTFLPKVFFNLGWTKVGIVTKNPQHFINIVKDETMTDLGFTISIQKSLQDYEGNYGSYDGFFLDDGLSTENIIDIYNNYTQP